MSTARKHNIRERYYWQVTGRTPYTSSNHTYCGVALSASQVRAVRVTGTDAGGPL